MAHEDAGHYAGKHPKGTTVNPVIEQAIIKKVNDQKITCSAATNISHELSVSMAEVGKAVDILELRITHCQLGLYGYGSTKDHGKKVEKVTTVTPQLQKEINAALVDGRLSCKSAKDIANNLAMKKTDVTAACDFLKIKIKFCELGAF